MRLKNRQDVEYFPQSNICTTATCIAVIFDRGVVQNITKESWKNVTFKNESKENLAVFFVVVGKKGIEVNDLENRTKNKNLG